MPATGMSLPAITLPKKVSFKLKQKINHQKIEFEFEPHLNQKINKLNIIKPSFNLNINRLNVMAPHTMMKAKHHVASIPMMPRYGRGMMNLTNKLSKSSQIVANRSVNIILNVKNLILAHSVVTNCKSCR